MAGAWFLLLGAALFGSALSSCSARPPDPSPLRRLFGPALGAEVIAGRAEDLDERSPIVLLAGDQALVTIDLAARTTTRRDLELPPGSSCWGLARLRDGSLWTLKGRHSLIRVLETGRVVQEIPLRAAHFGLFGQGDRLLYQPADFIPPATALFAGTPGDVSPVPWSTLRTRPFPLARASTAALNLLSCGTSSTRERPCWFPDEPAVYLLKDNGDMRRVALVGLATTAPEVLLTSDNPARPVRDAYVDSRGTIWILSSGTQGSGFATVPGGWVLARFGADGEPLGTSRFPEPVRLILRAEPGRAWLLTGAGMVAEVVP
jgi:hypothetical protein